MTFASKFLSGDNLENSDQSIKLSIKERIIQECNNIYNDPKQGLIAIGSQLKINIAQPKKKVTVLLLGNHSAGKSTFINWYIEERVQKTGVAVETQGFIFVTSGKKRETLMGNATLHLYPQLKPLVELRGVANFLSTEVSTSRKKKFSMLTFIDTPGLVDGDMIYPFNVNQALQWMGGIADLIFVFFDPMGQALCKRTLNILERLMSDYTDKVRLYLAKVDEAGDEIDRQKVLMQIVQELCKRPTLNRTGFNMPCIYIPDASRKESHCMNQIDEVCNELEQAINRTVQNSLDNLDKDTDLLLKTINDIMVQDNKKNEENNFIGSRAVLYGAYPLIVLLIAFGSVMGQNNLSNFFGSGFASGFITARNEFFKGLSGGQYLCLFFALVYCIYACSRLSFHNVMSGKQKKQMIASMERVQQVKSIKEELYKKYLTETVEDLVMF